MIYHFILNPKSGKKDKKRIALEEAIKSACSKRQLSYHIYYTTCPGDATEYVRSMVNISQDRQRFICVGGDGTINEIVNSAPCNPNVEFGVMPHGSGNDFVKNFTNTELFWDIDSQLDGDTISLDLIKCNDCYCVNMVNIGFDCTVAREANRMRKNKLVPRSLCYIFGIVLAIFRKFGTKMRLVFDSGEVYEKELTLTAIGNGKFCGGGFMAAPLATLRDGTMDVVFINKITRLTFFSLVGEYKAGTYLNNQRAMQLINYKRVPHFKMEFDAPVPICIDGEIMGAKNIDFQVVKNGFNFVVPHGSKLIDAPEENKTEEAN